MVGRHCRFGVVLLSLVESFIVCAEMNAKALIDKIEALPPEQIAEIEDFVDFVRLRAKTRALRHDFAAASEPSLARVWNNQEDSIYDAV
jgi:hypothetical protein